MKKKDSEL
jgi:hypothetical protein